MSAAVGDRIVGWDFDDKLVVLDSRDGTELSAYELPEHPNAYTYAAVGPRELALIGDTTITVINVDSGAQLRSYARPFVGDDDKIRSLWPGPDGGFFVEHVNDRAQEIRSLWLLDREAAPLEKLAHDVVFPTVTEVDGRWLWAVKDGGELSLPNAGSLPSKSEGSLADMIAIGELRALASP